MVHTAIPTLSSEKGGVEKCTKDLDWEPVWEPDGELADILDPQLRMGPSSSSPSGVCGDGLAGVA